MYGMMKKNKIIFMVLIAGLIVCGLKSFHKEESYWIINEKKGQGNVVIDSLNMYKEIYKDTSYYHGYLQEYNTSGDYLNFGKVHNYKLTFANSEDILQDNQGLPKVKHGEDFFYNPVTIAQYALCCYGSFLDSNRDEDKGHFFMAVDKLLELQDANGAFRYNFYWTYYFSGETYAPGWVSGMAQGQAMSVLARAWLLTRDDMYLIACKKAFDFLLLPVEQGGCKSDLGNIKEEYKNYLFFEEYICKSFATHTLNGYMYSLLGVYDYAYVLRLMGEDNSAVEKCFDEGIDSLEVILPYFDIQTKNKDKVHGFTAYDLGYLSPIWKEKEPHVGIKYHGVHIYLCHALYSISGRKRLKDFEHKWISYVSQDNKK